MSDTNFKPGGKAQYGAGFPTDVGPQHPRGDGMSHNPQHRLSDPHGREGSYMDQAGDMAGGLADDAWRAGRDYYEQGSRRVSEWADDHPNQLWTVIAVASAIALWMAYRPIASRVARSDFDPADYHYRRLPGPSGRAAFLDGGKNNI